MKIMSLQTCTIVFQNGIDNTMIKYLLHLDSVA